MRNHQRGFTLIETIIALLAVSLVLAPLASFFFVTVLGPVQNSAQLTVSGDIQRVSDWISRDLVGGPMGNNLGLSESSPSLASVTIGSSPGFPGNNSLVISYHTWPAANSTTPESHTVTYRLEDMDPTDEDIQLVRRADDGSVVVVTKHVADPAHVVFSGSAQSSPGGVSSGLTLDITSSLEGSKGMATYRASLAYALPRSYQPAPAPAPSSQTWDITVPYWLVGKSGYWEVIETKGTGVISVAWQLASAAAIQIWIYQGEALGKGSGDSESTPSKVNAPVLASNSATTNVLAATTSGPQPAGSYTIYFFNGSTDYINTSSASVTYVSP